MSTGQKRVDPELLVLSKLLYEPSSYNVARLLGLTQTMFVRWKNVFVWIEKFENKYGKLPSVVAVTDKFPGMEFVNSPDNIEFYISKLTDSINRAAYVEYVNKLNSALNSSDYEEARRLTSDLYSSVVYKPNEVGDIISSRDFSKALEVISSYETVFRTAIPTGFKVIDEELGGWYKGEFNAFIGTPYGGKTWCLLQGAKEAVAAGHKVVIASGEMPAERVWLRFLSLWFELPAKLVRQGKLSTNDKNKIKKFSKEDLPGELVVIEGHGLRGTDLLRRKIMQYSPDVLLVDSWYSLIEKDRRARWEELANLCTEFKRLAMEMSIAIVVTHQLNRSGASLKKGADLSDIAGTFDLAGWLDVALFLSRTDEMKKSGELGLICRKARDFDPFSFTVNFRVNDGEPFSTRKEEWILEEFSKTGRGVISEDELDGIINSSMV